MAAADQLKLGDGMCRLGMSSEGKWGGKEEDGEGENVVGKAKMWSID